MPLVRWAKNRNVGFSYPTQNHGLATEPPAFTTSDLELVDPATFQGSLPVVTAAFDMVQPVVADSKVPPASRL
ncbi:MAG: hypothetical protein U0Y82_10675 [Thermoleophilia bacterium]